MVIPIGDENPIRVVPFVTWMLLVANVAVFLLGQPWAGGTCAQFRFFLEWAAVPRELFQGAPLDASQVSASTPPACRLTPVANKNVYLAILSSMFLHAGWVHLLGNMLYLWIFGNNVEDRLGHLRFAVFYVAMGAVATLVFAVANATSLTSLVGASGAIAGVLGAYLVLFPHSRVTVLVFLLPVQLPALLVLGMWFVLQLQEVHIGSMAGAGVAYLAHVAGFVAGAVYCLVAAPPPRRRRRPPVPPYWA
jgi:membrane associated rhomboid family serine protease